MSVVALVPTRWNLQLRPGTDFPFTATLSNGVSPCDLTNDTVTFTLFDKNGNVVTSYTNSPGGHTEPANGKTAFHLSHAITSRLAKNTLWTYEIRRILATTAYEYVYIVGEVQPV